MIERDHRLSVTRQCQLLSLPRSSFYHTAQPTPDSELELMRALDELHLQFPWMGSRSLRDQLQLRGFSVSRDRVRRLMRKIGIRAIYRKPRTTIPEKGHKVYPYLLAGLTIDRPNQVWAADIVRHEAPLKRVEVRDLRPLVVAAAGEKLRAACPWRCGVQVDSSSDNAVTGWYC